MTVISGAICQLIVCKILTALSSILLKLFGDLSGCCLQRLPVKCFTKFIISPAVHFKVNHLIKDLLKRQTLKDFHQIKKLPAAVENFALLESFYFQTSVLCLNEGFRFSSQNFAKFIPFTIDRILSFHQEDLLTKQNKLRMKSCWIIKTTKLKDSQLVY